jgi:hypothetical protein
VLEPALKVGLIDRDEETVVHVTGTGLKNPQYLRPRSNASTVRANLSDIERALS